MPTTLPKVALSIAGSDSGGGAGIQADLKTFAMFGCFGATAITAVTAQNTLGVQSAQLLEPAMVARQIESVAMDLPVAATKIGMLGSVGIIEAVATAVQRHKLKPIVLDPVMIAKSGDPLLDDNAVRAMARQLLPLADLVTPNRHEAAQLLGLDEPITTVTAATMAAERICKLGAQACVVKGTRRARHHHYEMVDVFFDGMTAHELAHPWHDRPGLHGSGCCYSAAITAVLAHGKDLHMALETARQFIHLAITDAMDMGHGSPPVNPLAWLNQA